MKKKLLHNTLFAIVAVWAMYSAHAQVVNADGPAVVQMGVWAHR